MSLYRAISNSVDRMMEQTRRIEQCGHACGPSETQSQFMHGETFRPCKDCQLWRMEKDWKKNGKAQKRHTKATR